MAVTLSQVEALFVGYFGRAADPAGAQYWLGQINSNTISYETASASFAVQPESTSKYPFLLAPNIGNVGSFINQVYQNLFNHAPDQAGLAYWSQQLTANLGNPAAVGAFITNVISGAQGADLVAVNAKIAVAADFTTQVTNTGTPFTAAVQAQSLNEIAATIDAATQAAQIAATTVFLGSVPASTLPLTPNVDFLVGGTGNDAFNGSLFFNPSSGTFVETLQTGDSLSGGAGTNTLTVGYNGANFFGRIITPALLSNMQAIVVTDNSTGFGPVTLDLSNSTGLATITSTASSNLATFSNLNNTLTTINLNNQFFGLTLGSTASAVAGPADTVAINLSGLAAGAISVEGYEILNLRSNGTVANVVTTITDASLTTLGIAGAQAITVETAGTLPVTLATVGAGTATGNVTLGSLTNAAFGVANVAVTGGAGNDAFHFGTTYTVSDVINGMGGANTLAADSSAFAGVTATQANVTNIQTLSMTSANAAATYTLGAFGASNMVLNVASANAGTYNFASGTGGLSQQAVISANQTANSAGTATTDQLNVTIGTPTAGVLSTGGIISNGFETIAITAQGGADTLGTITMLATTSAETINVFGAQNLLLGVVTTDVLNANTFTGNLTMVSGTTSAGGTSIVLTGGSGNDTLHGGVLADTISGGQGNDNIHQSAPGGTSVGDVLNGGSGADRFIFTGAGPTMYTESAGTTAVTSIGDFVAGTDKIVLIDTFGPFTSATVAATQNIFSANSLTAVYAGITAIAGSVTGGAASAAVVVVSTGTAAGTYLYVNDVFAPVVNATDMLINITGLVGTLTQGDIAFV